ncbi:Uncharacterized protein SCF082_LOCUS8794 [Durusdinium trenchii]|uniref:Uncharacterized protein n=1 Tax=Durusdinium trenchii TaxID=1381693 RepID=A0ABP0IUZ7_9DINO
MRTAGAVAQNIAAGSDTQVLLSTASDTPKLQRDCLSILESVYQLRHFKASDVHSSDCGLLKVESGLYPWPILWGGTFKEIAQRCWESPDRVIEESAALAARVGLLDAKDPDEFVREFCKVDAWPPEPGEAFWTSVTSWSFSDQSFWRGKAIAMSEVMTFARSIASSRFREGETVTVRLPVDGLKPVNLAINCLRFQDGSQKCLGAFMTWLCLMLASKLEPDDSEVTKGPVVTLASSLLRLRTIVKGSMAAADEIDSTIHQIVKQNIDSKVQPVSSLTWASILSAVSDAANFDQCMEKYNRHPEVQSFEATNSSPISLDNKKRQAVRGLLEATSPAAFDVLTQSTHDAAWAQGPFGEAFVALPFIYLGSVGKLEKEIGGPNACLESMPNEPYVTLDWSLPMSEKGQIYFFNRVRSSFDRLTLTVSLAQKKRYRQSPEELMQTRNLVVLFSQIVDHMQTRLPPDEIAKWIKEVQCGPGRDEDLLHLIHMRPATFSLSMLLSRQNQARQDLHELELKKVEAVEIQRQEVTAAQWKFFQSALQSDQAIIDRARQAPKLDAYMRVVQVDKIELAQQEISKMKMEIATSCGVGLDSVACLGICDFNMPTARQKQVCGNLIEGISIINSSGNPSLNSTLAIFPDYARDSCPHGLYDEEKAIIEGCFGLRMHLDTRFIDLHTPQQRSEGKSSMRRFSQGRVIVNQDTVAANIWMNSELSVFGRPINADEQSAGAPTTLLPKSSSLVLPEGSSPNSDLKISERVRPSVEQQSAQKGVCRFQALIESMVKLVPVPGPLLIVNITGYVEECAAAALNIRIKGMNDPTNCKLDPAKLYYLSLHSTQSSSGVSYAKSRVSRDILDAWLGKRLSFDGKRFDDSAVQLTDEEMKSIPGAEVISSIDSLKLQVCVRQGTQVVIHPDQARQWSSSGE